MPNAETRVHVVQQPCVVALADIEFAPRNANVMSADLQAKLKRNIARTGLYPPLVVRPKDLAAGGPPYVMIDGQHRSLVLQSLGIAHANAVVWRVDEREADIMLATLNRLHGSDDLQARAALIESLAESIPVADLAQLLPESAEHLDLLLKLQAADFTALDAEHEADASEGESPVTLSFSLYPEQAAKVRQALDTFVKRENLGKNADGNALYLMAVEFLSGAGWEADAEAAMDREPPIGGGGSTGDAD